MVLILVLKGDSHPTHKSKHIDDYCDDSGIQKKFSPPYVHEGVGEAEITFQWDVPTANCLLLQSDSHERYFESAFYDVERSGNRLCKYDGKSRDMIYYGNTSGAPLTCHMIYGSPVKFLLHPEVRDSKFDDHAQAGTYRGPSRDDESDHRCWVTTGVGALERFVTVDIGCMRIDERSVMARCDRNHPSHQPFAIDAPAPPPAPDFSKWLKEVYRIPLYL